MQVPRIGTPTLILTTERDPTDREPFYTCITFCMSGDVLASLDDVAIAKWAFQVLPYSFRRNPAVINRLYTAH